MKLLKSKVTKKSVILLLAISIGIAVLQLAPNVKAQADSSPTIYDSTYIDKLASELKSSIQGSNDEVKKLVSDNAALEKKLADTQKELADLKKAMVFEVIKLSPGDTLIAGASAEIIVRTKNAVVAYVEQTAEGGISNLISGVDIKNGVVIPDNQLLLVPKADGRGVKATKGAYIMIKGTYTIKQAQADK